uniref:Uncharacterized protein n=1 Tax=Anopheles arabiensis TaxID=7173 RepID=A0A453YJV5_ANOAR
MLRNKPSMLEKNAPMDNTRTDPIFTQEDREAEARRLAACICARGKTTIQCLRCGNLCFGRKFRPCPSHPKIVFLYDIRACSVCQGTLKHLEELPIDFETYQKLMRVGPARSSP